ncbi:hypothetical protein FGG08_003835 [Glutinoglossum americanum]|uniref:Uracil-DNA glycosylase-like domain-containing protein n=1 Tax=Glutinoglossum americanum TaxID=1670608 RepID=A0A9P8IAD2_9PEZI|nr:hypothetical protein FGG08_003835 [Glutinoglossum americanum]
MMYAETIASRNTVASHIRALSQIGKPAIDIALNDDEQGQCILSYSTFDKIEGEVSITAPHDARFDDIIIAFEGNTKVFVESLSPHAAASRTDANHRFLRVTQPIPSSSYPVPRVAEAGRTYEFPFSFVVPPQLVEQICRHQTESDRVHVEHLQLPPSLGGSSLASDGAVLLDDMAPDMARISYAIKVKIVRNRESDGKLITVAEKARKVRIIPASEEHPPLNAEDGNGEGYILRREKDLRKGVFKGKLGRLAMETAQPSSLRLPTAKSGGNPQATTMATVKLRFDPADRNTPPPKLGSLVSKLKVHTFYSTRPMNALPSKEDPFYALHRGIYSDAVQLSSRCIESVRWEQRAETDEDRRDSCLSTFTSATNSSSSTSSSRRRSSAAPRNGIFHTAEILVPITLPKCKAFPPTFHSCLVSRIYVLDLALTAHAPGGSSISASSLTLKVPIQISAAGNTSHYPQEPGVHELEEYFNPRSIAPPAADLIGTSSSIVQMQPRWPGEEGEESGSRTTQQLPSFMMANAGAAGTRPPPGYSFFAGASQGIPVTANGVNGLAMAGNFLAKSPILQEKGQHTIESSKMVKKESPGGGVSPNEPPSSAPKLQRYSFDPATTPSITSPIRRRSPRLNTGESTPSVEAKPQSRTPKRKADEISDAPAESSSPPAKPSLYSLLQSPPSRRKSKAETKKAGRGSGYRPPEKYAHLKLLPDTLEPNLICVFVGLNPGIRTAQMGHAYSHPSNLFWKLLHSSGLTPRRFHPTESRTLPALCALGNTNIVARPTRDQSELSKQEMDDSVAVLVDKMRTFKPEAVCIVGKGIWESIFRTRYGRPLAKAEFKYGWQHQRENMGAEGEYKGARVFVATTTSGLAASLSTAEKEEIWRPLGEWVQKRRAERAQVKAEEGDEEVEEDDEEAEAEV